MKKQKVLFICTRNSARSQMAAAFLNNICPDNFEAQSAGMELGGINQFAIEVMREEGIDISANKTQLVFDVLKSGIIFSYAIRVCSEAEMEQRACPIFAGPTKRLSWPFPDPAAFQGSPEAKLECARTVRNAIKKKIEEWCNEVCLAGAPSTE